jgi:hypothetical protein
VNKEYLEDYEKKESEEYERFYSNVQNDIFSFDKDLFPSSNRFKNLQNPVAIASSEAMFEENFWGQVPFSGSLIVSLPVMPKILFEKIVFKTDEIPDIIDFVKETGKLQIGLQQPATQYEGLDFLDPFFQELQPPQLSGLPLEFFGTKEEIFNAGISFATLFSVNSIEYLNKLGRKLGLTSNTKEMLAHYSNIYTLLKVEHWSSQLVEIIENALVDNPPLALRLLSISDDFIVSPRVDVLSKIRNYTLTEIQGVNLFPDGYTPKINRFPCEIGKFLLNKLTCAPKGLRACNELIDHYASYDLQKLQESLNEAIVNSDFDLISDNSKALSEVLDNVWTDSTLTSRIKNLKRGIKISVGAIGPAIGFLAGDWEGFLLGLGFHVGASFIDVDLDGIAEKVAKVNSKSYQANVYDFQKKYNIKK